MVVDQCWRYHRVPTPPRRAYRPVNSMNNVDEKPLYDTATAAALLGMRPSTLRTWRSKGKGPTYVQVGDGPRKAVRYRLHHLQIFMVMVMADRAPSLSSCQR